MPATLQELKDAAVALPVIDRAELADYLIGSLDETEADDEAAIRIEWLTLAERRMADVEAGRTVGIPAEEVMGKLLEPNR